MAAQAGLPLLVDQPQRSHQRPWRNDRSDRSDESAGQRTRLVRRRVGPPTVDHPQGAQLALAALERRGLVERKQDPQHGRIMQAYLTDEGRAKTAAVLADAIAAHERVFGVLTNDEQQLLHDLLARVVEQGTGHALFKDHPE